MSCCGQDKDLHYDNECSNNMDDKLNGIDRNFCSLIGSYDNIRSEFCKSVGFGYDAGDLGEWQLSSERPGCNYYDYTGKYGSPPRTKWHGCSNGAQCCNGECNYIGESLNCKRKAFKADHLTCCLRDYSGCNKDDVNYCFETSEKKYTCAPEYRDQSGSSCQVELFDYCTGVGNYEVSVSNNQEFINRWISNVEYQGVTYFRPCYYSVYRNMFTVDSTGCVDPELNPTKIGTINNTGFTYSQNVVNGMIQRYLNTGGNLASTESSQNNTQLNSMIYEICSTNPGLCQESLFSYCGTVNTDLLQKTPQLSTWCGCYMPSEQYSNYTETYGIQRQCTPTCNMSGVIQLSSNNGVGVKKCDQSTCVIDDISINIANSLVGVEGEVNFTQLCNSCSTGGSTCNCTIANTNITIINSTIGNFSVEQQCSSSVCYSTGDNDTTIQVPCDGSPYNPYAEIDEQSKINQENAIKSRNIKILILFIILIITIIVIWYFFSNIKPKNKIKN
jgi:hypothetical protein